MNEEELLEEIKRHIDYTNAMGEKSLRDLQIENLYNLLQQKENIIKDIKSQLEYIETYSSKEDVFEDMKRRLDRIESIVNRK